MRVRALNGPLGAVAAAAAAAAVLGAAPAAAAGNTVVLSLAERTTSTTYEDGGAPGPSVGDVLRYTTELRDTGGVVVGTKHGVCRSSSVTDSGHLLALCAELVKLSAGDIATVGVVDQTALPTGATQTLAAIGASGTYANLRGTERFHATAYPVEFTTTITLR